MPSRTASSSIRSSAPSARTPSVHCTSEADRRQPLPSSCRTPRTGSGIFRSSPRLVQSSGCHRPERPCSIDPDTDRDRTWRPVTSSYLQNGNIHGLNEMVASVQSMDRLPIQRQGRNERHQQWVVLQRLKVKCEHLLRAVIQWRRRRAINASRNSYQFANHKRIAGLVTQIM